MSTRTAKIVAHIRRVAPYLAIELVLPGGSIVALTLWVIRNRASVLRTLPRMASRLGSAAQLPAVLRPSTASSR
jgi:hypothetical protein